MKILFTILWRSLKLLATITLITLMAVVATILFSSVSLLPVLNRLGVHPQIAGYSISFRSLELDYQGGFRVTGDDVEIDRPGEASRLKVRRVEGIIAPIDLLRANLFPSVVTVRGLSLSLERRVDGIFFGEDPLIALGVADVTTAESGDGVESLLRLLETLHEQGEHRDVFDALRRLHLDDLNITLDDRVVNTRWFAEKIDLAFTQESEDILKVALSTTLVRDDDQVPLSLSFSHQQGALEVPYTVTTSLLSTRSLNGYIPTNVAELFRGPLKVGLQNTLTVRGEEQPVSFTIAFATGELSLPDLFSKPLPLRELQLEGSYSNAAGGTLNIGQIAGMDGAATSVTGSLKLTQIQTTPLIDLKVIVGETNIEHLAQYLPDQKIPEVYRWVEGNLHKAKISEAELTLNGPLQEFPFQTKQSGQIFRVAFPFRDLEVNYYPPFAKGEKVSGKFLLENGELRITSGEGMIRSQKVSKLELNIADLYSNAVLSVRGEVQGAVGEVIQEVAKITPQSGAFTVQAGDHQSQVSVVVPLSQASDSKKQQRFQATLDSLLPAELVQPILREQGIVLAGAPRVSASLLEAANKTYKAKVSLDLKESDLSVARFDWRKRKGEPTSISADCSWRTASDEIVLSNLIASGPALNIRGNARFSHSRSKLQAKLQDLVLAPLTIGESDFSVRYQQQRWTVDGKQLILASVPEQHGDTGGKLPEDLLLNLSLNRLQFGEEKFSDARGFIERREGLFDKVQMDFRHASGALTRVVVTGESEEEKGSLTLRSEDAGAVFRVLGIPIRFEGGRLDGKVHPNSKGVFDPTEIHGKFLVRDARVVRSPLLLKIVSFLSVQNLLSLKDTVPFSAVRVSFRRTSPIVKIDEIRADGPVINFYFRGEINEDQKTLKGEGEAVPFGRLGVMVEKVPLVGKAVSDLQRNLIAAHYVVDGKLDDPNVSLAVLDAIPDIFKKPIEFVTERK